MPTKKEKVSEIYVFEKELPTDNNSKKKESYREFSDELDMEVCKKYIDDSWDNILIEKEMEVVRYTNLARSKTQKCGSYGTFEPVKPLKVSEFLFCSSRKYVRHLTRNNYISHEDILGNSALERIRATGLMNISAIGENLQGNIKDLDAKKAVDAWLSSEDHCKVLMNPSYTHIGVGFYTGLSTNKHATYWVQNFATIH